MANKVTIDVEARFVDEVTGKTKYVISGLDDIGDAADDAQKSLDKVGKKRVNPILDVDNNKFLKKLNDSESKAARLAGKTFTTTIKAVDKATSIANKVESGMRKLVGKTWSTVVKVKDYATAPLTKIKNMLFSMKSLALAIGGALAAKQFIANPINLADSYSSAQIGFKTLLGEQGGQKMMDDLDQFAKATPFKSAEVISQTQRMIAMGWDAENIIKDMTTIGDAAAATGKGEQGLQQIVTALAQIKSKGKLSTEELNQLAEAGVSAKRYIAEGLGYGSGDEGIAAMTKDLEGGAIASGKAIEALLGGMKEYQGMMEKTANETAAGLWSQIEDTFEINIFRRWGQGLQDGAKKGFGSIVELLDEADASLATFGDTVYKVGKTISNYLADRLKDAVATVQDITRSAEFKNASLGEKISMLWKGVIANPFSEWWKNTVMPWWDGTAVPWLSEKAAKLGKSIGTGLSKGLLALLGVDYVGAAEDGASIAGGFVKGFLDGFDGSAVTQAFVDAISDVWKALPWWAKMLIGGYGTARITSGIGNLIGGIAKFIGTTGGTTAAGAAINPSGLLGFIGSANKGTGLLGFGSKAAINMGAGNLAGGASMSAGALSALGLASTAGFITGGATAISGGVDLYKGYKNNDATAKKSGGWKLAGAGGGAALGAAIGSIIPGVGTVVGAGIGAGVGSLVGLFGSTSVKKQAVETARLNGTLEELASSESVAAEEAQKLLKKQKELAATSLAEHFGDVRLSAKEMNDEIRKIIGEDYLKRAEAAATAIEDVNAAFADFGSQNTALKKDVWEANRKGAKLTEEDVDSLKGSVEAFGKSAQTYVTDAQYAAEESVKAIMGDSKEAEKIIDSTNKYYDKKSKDLENLQVKLNRAVERATSEKSEGGIEITVKEQESIDNIRNSMSKIIQQIQQEEYESNLNIAKAKYQTSDMSAESFGQMMTGAAEQANTLADTYWDAFGKASIGKSDKEIETLRKNTMDNLADIWGNTADYGLGTIQERYEKELGILGQDLSSILENNTVADIRDAVEKMGPETQAGIGELMKKMEPTTEQVQSLVDSYKRMGLEDQIPEALTSYLETAEFYEAVAKGPKAIEEYFSNEKISPVVDIDPTFANIDVDLGEDIFGNLPASYVWDVEANANTTWTYDQFDDEWITPDGQYSFTTEGLVEAGWTYNDFDKTWISPDEKYSFQTKGEVTVEYLNNKFPDNKDQFGIKDAYNKETTVNVAVKYKISGSATSYGNPKMDLAAKSAILYNAENNARGGIVGGTSAMKAFARGGRPDDGMLKGSTRFIKVNEESPEMIIPLSSQRRERGMKLWEKTGELLGVPGFARGGRTSGGQDEGIRFRDYGHGDGTGGQSIQIDVGGIVFEIHVNGTDAQSIAAAIKEQIADIAEDVAGVMADAFAAQFENTPVRGGAA